MQKRIIAAMLCVAMLLGLLAGCKPRETAATTAPATTTAPGETVPEGGNGPEQEQPAQPSDGEAPEEEKPEEEKPGEEDKTDQPQTGGQPGGGLPSYMVRFFTNGGEAIQSGFHFRVHHILSSGCTRLSL